MAMLFSRTATLFTKIRGYFFISSNFVWKIKVEFGKQDLKTTPNSQSELQNIKQRNGQDFMNVLKFKENGYACFRTVFLLYFVDLFHRRERNIQDI